MWFKKKIVVPVEVSARHCHLCKADLNALFGGGKELTKLRQLSQPLEFACQETVNIIIGSKQIGNVRIVGPLRTETQVEISLSDAVGSGIEVPVLLSGQLENSASVVITGPAGRVELNKGLIVAKRHIHCATSQAGHLGLKNSAMVKVRVKGERSIVFENVIVRTGDNYKFCIHLDTDEGNACGINKTGEGYII